MSEEIDLNASHLCTTEDAFEQFQASSMYEEDEYITLSDIVSPPPQPPDLTVDLNDIPFENEVVLESQLEEQVPEVNSTIEIGTDDNEKLELLPSNSALPIREDNSEIGMLSKSTRGRRKKTQQNDSVLTLNQNHNEQGNSKQEASTPDGMPAKSRSTNRRGGRRPKRNGQNISRKRTTKKSLYSTEELSSELQPGSTNVSNDVSECDNAPEDKVPRRRGARQKKQQAIVDNSHLENETDVMTTELQPNESKVNDSFLTDNSLNKITSKRGRRKRKEAVNDINKDCGSQENTEGEPETTFDENNLAQTQTEEISTASLIDQANIKIQKSPIKHKKSKKIHEEPSLQDQTDIKTNLSDDDDMNDDICLSKLKQTLEPIATSHMDQTVTETSETMEIVLEEIVTTEPMTTDENSMLPTSDEIKIDDVAIDKEMVSNTLDVKSDIKEVESTNVDINVSNEDANNSLLIEDTSKRPKRVKARKTFNYDDGSDEDPYANMESSDEEPKRGKKGKRYYSDDEYVPGANKRGNVSSSDISDSDIDAEVDELMMTQRRKKQRLSSSQGKSPRKRGRKLKAENEINGNSLEVKTIAPDEKTVQDDDIEICLQSSHIKADDDTKQKLGWGVSNEFENFLAKRIHGTDLQIKKSSTVQPLEIPVIDPNDVKRTVETGMQTTQITTNTVEVQTTAPYDLPMKDNVPLTSRQAENACEFLKGIVKTTSELGQLMTQKSEDFITKKINTSHITDTFKMDYCVRKSFLLFKLAKHNLMQMEEDLSKQYNEFLTKNDLIKHREKPKLLTAVKKSDDGDSDCEIIDSPIIQKPSQAKPKSVKPKFNPKTVFLNKELSIKIAKKPTEVKKEKKLDIKGRHTVWISDSVMVKKVKPTQSFLAQDSRNKKPPDCVTLEMVSNFFKEYDRQQALLTCAPFITTNWLSLHKKYVCSYFLTKPDDYTTAITEIPSGSELNTSPETQVAVTKDKLCQQANQGHKRQSPRSLFSLCAQVLQTYLNAPTSKLCDKTEIINGYPTSTIECPKTLYSICVTNLQGILNNKEIPNCNESNKLVNVVPLQTLCLQKVVEMMGYHEIEAIEEKHLMTRQNIDVDLRTCQLSYGDDVSDQDVMSLFSLCVIFIQNQMYSKNGIKKPLCDKLRPTKLVNTPNSLQNITLKVITTLMTKHNADKDCSRKLKSLSDLCFETVTKLFADNQDHMAKECLTINSINRLTDEAFFNMEESTNFTNNLEYYADDDSNFYDDEAEEPNFNEFDETTNTEDSNWVSQVEMKEFISIPARSTETVKPTVEKNVLSVVEEVAMTRIKIEPEEDHEQVVDSSIVKTEPTHNLDEMTILPESIVTNSVTPENDYSNGHIQRRGSASFDVDTFEAFVRSNKMINAMDNNEIKSRIKMQHEPDSDTENDMSLLVPQTFEPLVIENAKDSLMESSGDENSSSKKLTAKKKTDRRRGKTKKLDATKSVPLEKSSKEISKEKQPISNEIAILTRRMRGKIRQEEKKIASSDSENESSTSVSKADKETTKENSKTKQKVNKPIEEEIQCNNVDSTEQSNEQNKCISPDPSMLKFTGFTAIDQNEVSNYQKYVKYVYDKILPPESDETKSNQKTKRPFFSPEEPVELLECEPAMPCIDDDDNTKMANVTSKKPTAIKDNILSTQDKSKDTPPYEMRHGWKCYQLDPNDSKLYLDAQILLEKLPETFVDTYFRYQNISQSNIEDEEVNRLVNLQSLNRLAPRGRGRPRKNQPKDQIIPKASTEDTDTNSRPASPANSEHYDELTPSEDESSKVDDQSALSAKKDSSENTLAKSSLMDDNDSEEEAGVKIKKEKLDSDASGMQVKKTRPGPKSKCKPAEPIDAESYMLTADKMMNRELNLLHAPVVPGEETQEISPKGPVTRNKQKHSSKGGTGSKRVKNEDDGSSSEEEKHQWFTIKEKLLKKMLNKKDTTREDDAKRAKLVSEFIERRGDLTENYLKRRKGGRSKRSLKKMLERQKQFKVLSRELFGDAPDTSHTGKGKNSAYFKGRRNIRKVLDKKSLAKSTVLANMEEFERKRRINIRQNQLRELLGCEEGVNVLVINDEVCLEYDFETQQPVVTIHPFFTKVMKAHQYEGVKFMWDACFESLSHVESGHPGGGCILAHCMGLGKTLQVLALLHTVLTHPRVGMQRVLVCCPLSTVLNWVDEIHKWIGPVTDQIKVFELSKLRKTNVRAYQLEDWYKGGGIFIIGYELFRSLTTLDPYLDDVRPVIINKIRNALLDPGPDIIICDEGHLLKNDCSVLAVAMSRVRTKRRIVLTGTPMQNNLREYFCMVNFVKPNLLGTYAEYSNRFENPIMNGQHRDSREEDIKLMKARTHILHKVLEGCLQRQEASVLYPYLPKKHEYTVFVSLTKCQWDLYKHYLQNCTVNQTNKNNVLKDFHILQKIWSHPQVLHNFQSRSMDDIKNKVKLEKLEDDLATEDLNAEDIKPSATDTWWLQYLEGGEMLDSLHCSNKFVCVFRILDECIALGDKLLIFSTSLFTMDALEYFLKRIKSWSLGKEYYRLDGSVPAEVRQKWCREFNAEINVDTKLFLISTRAGCLGLNMTAANRVIILDTSWNPAHDIQSIFRVYRFGQKKDCYIYRLVALGTMEQKIYERSVTKQAVACRVVDEQQIDRHYNSADLTELYKYDELGVGVASGVAVGVEDVVLLRVARDANLHAVHEHDSLLRGSHEQGLPEHERNAAWMQFQQEHAHKQIEDLAADRSKIAKKVYSYDKPATAKSTHVKNEPEDPVFQPKPEKKRGPKKNMVVTCSIPIESLPQSNTAMPLDNDREEDLVNRITHILIKHDFHIRQDPREIADLVSKVRKIISSGSIENSNETDPLSISIAHLLLQNDLPMRQVTNIMCESVNNSIGERTAEATASSSKVEPIPPVRGRSKRKIKPPPGCRKGYVYEEIKPVEKEPQVEHDGRRRRRAALRAEKSFDTITGDPPETITGDTYDDTKVANDSDGDFVPDGDDYVPGGDDYGPVVAEYVPGGTEIVPDGTEIVPDASVPTRIETARMHNATIKEEPKDDKPKRRNKSTPKNETTSKRPLADEEITSIILSDDDEPPPPKKRPGPARKTMKVMLPAKKRVEEEARKVKEEEEEARKVKEDEENRKKKEEEIRKEKDAEESYPLHPSLLSNQNFIKIVAHTYLTGNPMLDEDAATLAAQYSTQKALKEFENTRKDIKSGPLYDIAVQVLGMPVLKKLHETKVKSKSAQPTPEKPKETHVEPADVTVKETVKETIKNTTEPSQPAPKTPLKPIKLKIRLPSSLSAQVGTSLSSAMSSPSLAPMTVPSSSLKPVPTATMTSSVTSAQSSYKLKPFAPAPAANVVPVGFYRLDVSRPIAPWSNVDINSYLERNDDGYYFRNVYNSFLGAAEIPANNAPQSADECILPDDDDIHIVSDPVPAPPAPVVQSIELRQSTLAPAATNQTMTRRQKIPLVLNNVQSAYTLTAPTETTEAAVPSNKPQLHNTTPTILTQNKSLPPAACTAPQESTSSKIQKSYTYINLDSDDEDLPSVSVATTPNVAPQPVPVSLTTSNPLHPPNDLQSLNVPLETLLAKPTKPPPIVLNNQYGSVSNALMNNIVLVPGGNLKFSRRTELPPGAVPISVNRVDGPMISGASSVGETVNIPSEESESILPNPTPPRELLKKTLCKPGDVLRITKSGKIEVLNRRDQSALPSTTNYISKTAAEINQNTTLSSQTTTTTSVTTTQTIKNNTYANNTTTPSRKSTTPNSNSANTSETIEIDDDPTVTKPVPAVRQLRGCKKSTELQTSESKRKEMVFYRRKESPKSLIRPPSPPDPLSIFRDVVHIEADNYESRKPSDSKIATKEATAKSMANTASKPISESSSIKTTVKNKVPATKAIDSGLQKSVSQKDKRVPNALKSTQSIIDSFKAKSGMKVSLASPVKNQDKKTPSKPIVETRQVTKTPTLVMDSKKSTRAMDSVIDITSFDDPPAATDRKGKSKVLSGSTIVGTSKDIILCGAGKAIKRPQAPPIIDDVFESKRASTSTENSAKKKKTEKPMTLKDFDIDDIDDIIELD